MSMGGGGGGSQNQSTTSEVVLPDWAQQQVQANLASADQLASQPYVAPPMPTVAGFNPDQTAAFNAVRANVGSTDPSLNTAISNVTNLPQTTQSLLNPYLGYVGGDTVSNIQRAAAQTGEANAANAANVGAFGGSRTGVQSDVLASETQRNIGQAINQISAQGWNTASGLALNQATELGQLATAKQQADLTGIGALSQVGGQEQAQTQAGYSSALQQWQAAQNWPYQQLAIQQSALAGSPYGTTVQSQQPYSTNPAATAIGLTAAGLPIANQIGNWAGLWGPGSSTGSSTASAVSSAIPTFSDGSVASSPSAMMGLSDPVDTFSNAQAASAAASGAAKGGASAGTGAF